MTYLENALDYYMSGDYLNSEECTPFFKDVVKLCIDHNNKKDLPIDITEDDNDPDSDMIGLLWVLHELNFQSVTDELLDDMFYCLYGAPFCLDVPAMYGRAYVRKYSKDSSSSMLDQMKALVLPEINKDVLSFFNSLCNPFHDTISDTNDPYNRMQRAIYDLNDEFFGLTAGIDDDDLYDDEYIDTCIIDGMDTPIEENRRKVIALYAIIYKLAAIADIDSFTHLTMEMRPLPKIMLHELYVVLVRATELENPNDDEIGKLMIGVIDHITDENIRKANTAIRHLAVQRLNSIDDAYSNNIIAKYVEKWSK